MNKAVFALLTALAYGAFAGEVLSGDAAKAKFPAAVQAMELSETKWSQLMTGVEYGFTHAADLYGVPDDLHVLKIDYAKAPIKMKILEHSPNKMRTSEAAAEVNALFAINGTMYNPSVGKPVYHHKVDGRVVTPESGDLPNKVPGLAFNPDKSFDFSGTATLTFADWDNIISCDCLLSKGDNMMKDFSWAKDQPSAGYPLIGMTPEKVLVILVIDGRRQGISQGINYYNAAELLKEFGCAEGILYDGGGSTTLAMRNDIVPAADFATTQVVPDYCAGYTIMNFVNAGSSWVEREVIDQIAFVAEVPPPPNEFRVTPYVQHPAPTAMTLKFLTTTNTAATVYWWPEGNVGGVKSASVMPRLAEELQYYGDSHAQQCLPEMTPWQYRYRIEGLEPDSTYCYRVVLTDGETYEKSFRTAPAKNRAIRFVCYSDSETQPSSTGDCVSWDDYRVDQDTSPASGRKYFVDQTVGYASNICTMVERKPDFFVVAGDLAETGSKQTHWDEYWRHNAGELNDPAGSIPILAALGNHEYAGYSADANGTVQPGEQGAKKFLSYFEFEPNGAAVDADQQQRFHRMDYGPVAMIFIDPNNGPDNEPPEGTSWSWAWEYANPHERDTNAQLYEHRIDGGVDKSSRVPQFQEGSAQYKWLEEQLADAQTNKLFTFLVCHQCPFSAGYHGRASGELGRGAEAENLSGVPTRCLTNLVFKYGVDGWICGHDEMYEHSQVQGEETLPDGTKRPMTLNVWDVGIGGDGLRGCRITENPNPYEVFRAHVDAPEEYDENGTLVAGGKHYGHLEVDVGLNDDGLWTAKLTPAYVFVSKDMQTGNISFERRTYDDVVVVTNMAAGVQKVAVPTASAPEGKAKVTLDVSEALVGGVVNGTLADVADGYTASVFVGGRKVAVKDGAFSFVASDDSAQNQVTVSLVSDDAWYLMPSNRVDLKIASGVSTGSNPGDIMTTEDGASVFIAPSLSSYAGGKAGLVQYAANALYAMTSETSPSPVNGSFVAHGSAAASVASFAVSAAAGFALNGSAYGDTSHGVAEQDLRDDRDLSVVWPFGGPWGDAANFGAASDARVAMKTDMVKSMGKVYERLAPLVFSTDGTKVYGNNFYQPEVYELAVTKEGETVKSILCTGKYWTLPARATAMACASVNGEDVVFLTCANGEFVSFKPSEDVVGNNDFTARYVMLKSYRQLVVTGRTDGNLHLIGNTTGGQIDVYAIAADGSGLASTEPLATASTSTALIKPIANGFTCRDDELGAVFNYRTDGDIYVRTVSKAGYGAFPQIDDPEHPGGPDQPDDPPAPPEEPEDETVIYVSPSGDGTAPHRGFATGYASIQDAIDAANVDDTVILDKTTFEMPYELKVNKKITLCGAGENWETVLDGMNRDGKITVSAAGAWLHTFTFTKMGSDYAGSLGVVMNVDATISDVVARQNGNPFSGNARYPFNLSAGTLSSCWITNNWAPNNGAVGLSGSAVMENCYVADNRCSGKSGNSWPGIVDVSGSATVRNCTIVNNKSNNYVVRASESAKFYNNIIWGNTYISSTDNNNWTPASTGMSMANWKCNCTSPLAGSTTDGNTDQNPQLQEDQMHFFKMSPCNHTGNPTYATAVDLENNDRGQEPSMGAFEYVASATLSCQVVADRQFVNQPGTITLCCTIEGDVADPLSYEWDLDGDGTPDSQAATPELSAIGVYNPVVTITDNTGKSTTGSYATPLVVYSESGAVYVTSKENPNAKAPFATWETAATCLNDALPYATVGATVFMDDGTHYLTAMAELTKKVTIISTNGCEHTFLARKSGTFAFFQIKVAGTVIDGFTIENQSFPNYAGGSIIAMEHGTLRNCRFIRNTNIGHSGVYLEPADSSDDMVVENCAFIGNCGSVQGPCGLLVQGRNPRVINCLFVANTNKTEKTSYPGEGIIVSSASAQIINCTVVSNVSYNAGSAGIYNKSGCAVRNCIVVGNARQTNDVENAGQYVYLDSNAIGTNPAKQSHSLVWPTTYDYSAFTKVLTEDPQFKTNYTFSSYGPCVRKGLYQDWMKGATDFFGNSRATPGKHVDMGYWQSPDPGMMLRVR